MADVPLVAGATRAPLIAHIIYRLDVGGLENGLVNLVNHMPPERFRHAIVSLTDATRFSRRISRPDVAVHCLHKPAGNSVLTQLRLWRLLRSLRPDIVHTRNLAALECTVTAAMACKAVRVHGEHGRDIEDPDGTSTRRRRIRRLFKPWVHRYVAVSSDLARYLEDAIAVPAPRVAQIYNGVDTERFSARHDRERDGRGAFVIGTAGRMDPVKDPLNLVRAFLVLRDLLPEHRSRLKLAMAGDGVLRQEAMAMLAGAGVQGDAWLPGTCDDVPEFMRRLDLFVLPSRAEGVSNTVLEAMASGLPVVATRVGGNPELVEEGVTGTLAPAGDSYALARTIARYVVDHDLALRHGAAARLQVEQRFGLQVMVRNYLELYEQALAEARSGSRLHATDRRANARCAG